MSRLMKVVFSTCFFSCLSIDVSASPIRMDFLAFNFNEVGGSTPAVAPAVTGVFHWETNDDGNLYGEIDHLTSADLRIAGHSYMVSELGSKYIVKSGNIVEFILGGKLNGEEAIQQGTDDFWLTWSINTLTGNFSGLRTFSYSVAGQDHTWFMNNYSFAFYNLKFIPEPVESVFNGSSEYALATRSVPESSGLFLMLIGLTGLLLRVLKK